MMMIMITVVGMMLMMTMVTTVGSNRFPYSALIYLYLNVQTLKTAVAQGDVEALSEALKEAKKHNLQGEEEDGIRFLCPEVTSTPSA